jgi:hypothetical protein
VHEPLLSLGGFKVRHVKANGILATAGGFVVRLHKQDIIKHTQQQGLRDRVQGVSLGVGCVAQWQTRHHQAGLAAGETMGSSALGGHRRVNSRKNSQQQKERNTLRRHPQTAQNKGSGRRAVGSRKEESKRRVSSNKRPTKVAADQQSAAGEGGSHGEASNSTWNLLVGYTS